jgi:alkylated DNA repair dioxygenase AlkB
LEFDEFADEHEEGAERPPDRYGEEEDRGVEDSRTEPVEGVSQGATRCYRHESESRKKARNKHALIAYPHA